MEKRDTLLLVDDVEVNRAILRGIFEREYNLLEAENGDQALVLIEQYHGRIAAILLDLVMPVRDGYQVLEALGRRGLLAELPVIVINDGRVMDHNLTFLGYDRKWLANQLRQLGASSPKSVFLLTADRNGTVHYTPREVAR